MHRLTLIWPLILLGTLGGVGAYFVGLPMPFMLGGIAGAGCGVALIEARRGPADLRLPKPMREVFIAFIGTMIGASFTPDLLGVLPLFWPSVLAILLFIAVAQVGGFLIMHRIGGYSRVDALYASMPGGLIEASILGEKAGADAKLIAVQHFIRVLLVVFTVPFLFWALTGQVVGSAGGQGFSVSAYDFGDVSTILAVDVVGLILGKLMRLPASHMMGPLILSAGLHVTGAIDVASPPWLLHLAQLVVGVGLGAQFSGLNARVILRGLSVGMIAVSFMLCLSFVFAWVMGGLVPAAMTAMFLSYAPGGVTEMSLIALSLNISPVIVAVHHLIRIVCTVFITQALGRRLI